MHQIPTQERLIAALDLPHYEQAESLVQSLYPTVQYFKIGMEMFYASGRPVAELVLRTGAKLFLDLKLHDIPNTVARALEQLTEIGAHMINVHIAGGEAMLVASREAVEKRAAQLGVPRPLLLGVTVLTSTTQEELQADGHPLSPKELVRRRAELALKTGLDGIVCSPLEAALVKEVSGGRLFTVTPGIRPISREDDQRRIATPTDAIKGGSDYLVVGRPIYAAADPLASAQAIQREIEEAVQ